MLDLEDLEDVLDLNFLKLRVLESGVRGVRVVVVGEPVVRVGGLVSVGVGVGVVGDWESVAAVELEEVLLLLVVERDGLNM